MGLMISYIDGLPGTETPSCHDLELNEEYLVIEAFLSSGSKIFKIPYDRISSIEIHISEIMEEKNKSVIGRGIVGGLIAGPGGMVLGGLSGLGTKKNVKKEPFFVIAYTDKNGNNANIVYDIRNNRDDCREFIAEFNEKTKDIRASKQAEEIML